MFIQRNNLGWLGIDVGSSSVKLVQVERTSGGLRVQANISIPRVHSNLSPEESSRSSSHGTTSVQGEIRAALDLSADIRGKHAAAAVSMSECEVHQLARNVSETGAIEQFVADSVASLTAAPIAGKQFGVWPAHDSIPGDVRHWNVLSARGVTSDSVYQDLVSNHLRCHAITSVPHALALTVENTLPETALAPFGVLDWGMQRATLAVVEQGNPIYVRTLKGCGLKSMIGQLSQSLGVDRNQAQRILQNVGLGAPDSETQNEKTELILESVSSALRTIRAEITRTLEYLKFQQHVRSPESLVLFGGGGLTRGIAAFLEDRLQMSVQSWTFEETNLEPNSARAALNELYGVAFGLSLMAWEK